MTREEGDVFHIAIVYEQEYRKFFYGEVDGQSIRRNSLPMRGDPRKSSLFRYCWKLRRETRGLLELNEYRNYIRANLFIIKHHGGHVEPIAITGDKAWIRYKVWKRRFDQKMYEAGQAPPPPSTSTTNPKIIREIDRTKKFLFEKCEGEPTFEKINNFVDKGIFKLWVAQSKISPYYLALSPYINQINSKDLLFSICTCSEKLILEKTTQEIKEYFKKEFKIEYDCFKI